jgi:hypothetical protein
MNIKLDENLPLQIAVLLRDLGHDVHTLREEQLFMEESAGEWTGCFVVATERKVRVLKPQL